MTELQSLLKRQLAGWPEAARRYRDLREVQTKEITIGGMPVRVQYNPARAVSTLARTDAASIAARPCFLCRGNRPQQQEALPFEGCDGRRYEILVNPFPIFPEHFTVPAVDHVPQRIAGRFPDMLRLAEAFPDMTVFYNGPESGASAPDHFHFQMGCRGFLPVEKDFGLLGPRTVMRPGAAVIALTSAYIPGLPVITAPDAESAEAAFLRVLRSLPVSPRTGEPQLNLLCWKEQDIFRILIIPRKAHRPSCYYAPEGEAVRISPASVDLGGVFIVPVEEDFRRTDAGVLQNIIRETVDTSWQPVIDVGLLTAPELRVRFNQPFSISGIRGQEGLSGDRDNISGEQVFTLQDGMVRWNGKCYGKMEFRPASAESTFTLHRVKIGINFHWEREEDQMFSGGLTILPTEEGLTAINSVPVEDYLLSVISSEMNGDAPEEFLKAHAVISRSWLLARPTLGGGDSSGLPDPVADSSEEHSDNGPERIIRWYDREDHTLFDVCADDHCQRYQGLLRAGNANIRKAVEATRGLVLTDGPDGSICDTRFSKCCGGVSERFSACWADEDFPYLQAIRDNAAGYRMSRTTCSGPAEDTGIMASQPESVPTPCTESRAECHSRRIASETTAKTASETSEFQKDTTYQPDKRTAIVSKLPDESSADVPDLSDEQTAREWILSSPEAFCNTSDPDLLSTVLNSYDQETSDFYRWKVEYTQAGLSDLLRRRSGIDFGDVLELRPLKRGASGRIIELLIRGTLRTVIVGKELEIRRWLSESHLYSSAFVVDTVNGQGPDISETVTTGVNPVGGPVGEPVNKPVNDKVNDSMDETDIGGAKQTSVPNITGAARTAETAAAETGRTSASSDTDGTRTDNTETHTVDTHASSEIHPTPIPVRFILHGAGWGHGVGLCQIGAAAMSAQGCTFDRILVHYFRGSCLTRLY